MGAIDACPLPAISATKAGQQGRVDALDALRGLAILTMILSGLVPRAVLPAWMYHAQNPPPTHQLNPSLPGLTWVDLVFPFFLFALGAAIPFALSRRLADGGSLPRVVGQILLRGIALFAFAVYIPHVDPWRIAKEPELGTWLISLLAFGIMFPALARLPAHWSDVRVVLARIMGWGGAIALVAGLWYVGTTELHDAWQAGGLLAAVNKVAARSDIIIVVLANMAVLGSLIWLISRGNLLIRLAVMAIMLIFRWFHHKIGWLDAIWNFHPVPALYQLHFEQYLQVVLPATIAGDIFIRRQSPPTTNAALSWTRQRCLAIAAVGVALNVFVLAALQCRWGPWQTFAGVAVLAVAICWFARGGRAPVEHITARLWAWAILWLILGLIVEIPEGGIKKSPATVSYYFVTTGLACALLASFTIVLDGLRIRRGFGLLIDNGRNPMIAYLGIRNLLPPLLIPSGIDAAIARCTPGAWLGTLRAILKTLLLGYIVRGLTRLRIYWRT
jgi:predicted acyltransferase